MVGVEAMRGNYYYVQVVSRDTRLRLTKPGDRVSSRDCYLTGSAGQMLITPLTPQEALLSLVAILPLAQGTVGGSKIV